MQSKRISLVAVVMLCSLGVAPQIRAADKDQFSLSVSPYIWLVGVTGDIGVKGLKTSVDETFFDIEDESDTLAGGFGRAEAHYGKFGLYADGGYMQVGADKISGPLGIAKVDFSNHIGVIDGGLMYRVFETPLGADAGLTLDATAGARYWTMGLEVNPSRLRSRSGGIGWFDPTVGLRSTIDLGKHIEVVLGGDVGGFNCASQFAWSGIGTIGYKFHIGNIESSVYAGYKAIYTDYSNGGFTWDATLHGPVIGMQFNF